MAYKLPRPDTAFTKSPVRRRFRQTDESHLKYIRKLPCCVTGARGSVEAAHIRMANPDGPKGETGMQQKPSDKWVVPLSARQHRGPGGQHDHDEGEWWAEQRINPFHLATELYMHSGDIEAGEQIIKFYMDKAREKS